MRTHINVGAGRREVPIGRITIVDELEKLVLAAPQPSYLENERERVRCKLR